MSTALPSATRPRRPLLRLGLLAGLFGLGFACGNLAFPQVNLRDMVPPDEIVPAPAAPRVRHGPEDIRGSLDAVERKLRTQLQSSKSELAATERTLYLMEQEAASKEALPRLHEAVERGRRGVDALEKQLAEVRGLRERLRRTDADRQPDRSAREQEELDELLARARLWLEVVGRD